MTTSDTPRRFAAATDSSSRIEPPVWAITVQPALALVGVLVTAAIGFLYRRERHLDWAFQQPDPPQGEHH